MVKLRKFKEKKLTNKNIMISFVTIIVLLITLVFSKSYAIYKMQKEFDVIKSQIGTFTNGDVKVAVLVDGKETNEFPSYETNYKIESVECTNGVTGSFDVENWQVTIADMKATSTKCTVSFNSKETNEKKPINMSKKEILALNDEITNMAAATILDKVYPVGSIYMSTEDDTVEKVQNKFGGTWVRYAEDTTLVGYKENTNKVNDTGGSKTVTLTTNNLPSHSHVIPSLNGKTVALNHFTKLNGTGDYAVNAGGSTSAITLGDSINSSIAHWTLEIPSLSLTTTESNTTTCTNCSANPINVQNPYTIVYMYKRTA